MLAKRPGLSDIRALQRLLLGNVLHKPLISIGSLSSLTPYSGASRRADHTVEPPHLLVPRIRGTFHLGIVESKILFPHNWTRALALSAGCHVG